MENELGWCKARLASFVFFLSCFYFFIFLVYSNLICVFEFYTQVQMHKNRLQHEMQNYILFIIFCYLHASKYKPHTHIYFFIRYSFGTYTLNSILIFRNIYIYILHVPRIILIQMHIFICKGCLRE
jgi:hypothetical protein